MDGSKARRTTTTLVALYLLLVLQAPINPLLANRGVFVFFLIAMTALAILMTYHGIMRGWASEVETLPGTDEADADRQRDLELHT